MKTMPKMNSAEAVIEKLGGLTAVSRELGHKHSTTVHGWMKAGSIPRWRHPELLALARRKKIDLMREELDAALRKGSMKGSDMAAESSAEFFALMPDQLEPETLAALRERARMSGQSLETEIKRILAQAARAGRSELATWSAGLRSRLRNRHVGDVTADIRSDRQR